MIHSSWLLKLIVFFYPLNLKLNVTTWMDQKLNLLLEEYNTILIRFDPFKISSVSFWIKIWKEVFSCLFTKKCERTEKRDLFDPLQMCSYDSSNGSNRQLNGSNLCLITFFEICFSSLNPRLIEFHRLKEYKRMIVLLTEQKP